jgi:hypothetical protein
MYGLKPSPFTPGESIAFTVTPDLEGVDLEELVERIEDEELYIEPSFPGTENLELYFYMGDGSAVEPVEGDDDMLYGKLDDSVYDVESEQHVAFWAMRNFDAVGEVESISTDGESITVEVARFPYRVESPLP